MNAVVFPFRETSHILLKQMSNCIQTRWKSDIQIAIYVSAHAGLHLFLTVADWQLVSLHLCEGLQYTHEDLLASLPVCNKEHWGEWEHRHCTVQKCYSLCFLMVSGISAWSHSASPHLLRTKRGLMGVHTPNLHSKGIGQGDSSLLPSAWLSTRKSPPLPLPVIPFLYLALSSHKKSSHTERHETAEHLKWCKNSWLCIWHIYIAKSSYE